MGQIDMVNEGVLGSQSPESTVQSGGGGDIEMLGYGVPMSHTPISSVQTGGGTAGLDMVGEQNVLNRNPVAFYGQIAPKDKGE